MEYDAAIFRMTSELMFVTHTSLLVARMCVNVKTVDVHSVFSILYETQNAATHTHTLHYFRRPEKEHLSFGVKREVEKLNLKFRYRVDLLN